MPAPAAGPARSPAAAAQAAPVPAVTASPPDCRGSALGSRPAPSGSRRCHLKPRVSQPLTRNVHLRRAAVTAFWTVAHYTAPFRFSLDQVMQQRVMDSANNQQEWAQQQRFGYDAVRQITREVRPFKEAHFSWDAAGNQTDKPGQVVWHNLLQRLKGARWAFDGFGRMVWRKSGPDAVEQHFSQWLPVGAAELAFPGAVPGQGDGASLQSVPVL